MPLSLLNYTSNKWPIADATSGQPGLIIIKQNMVLQILKREKKRKNSVKPIRLLFKSFIINQM